MRLSYRVDLRPLIRNCTRTGTADRGGVLASNVTGASPHWAGILAVTYVVARTRSAADERLEVASEGPRRASKKIGDELPLPADPLEEWATRPLPDVELSCFHNQRRAADEAPGQVWGAHRPWKLSTRPSDRPRAL